jgi:hypothetical protein
VGDPGEPEPDAGERMAILHALEAGEIDVAAALDRLAELDARTGGTDA